MSRKIQLGDMQPLNMVTFRGVYEYQGASQHAIRLQIAKAQVPLPSWRCSHSQVEDTLVKTASVFG